MWSFEDWQINEYNCVRIEDLKSDLKNEKHGTLFAELVEKYVKEKRYPDSWFDLLDAVFSELGLDERKRLVFSEVFWKWLCGKIG